MRSVAHPLGGVSGRASRLAIVRRQAPKLYAMGFEEIVAQDMVILGGLETVANAILRLVSQLDLIGLTMIFKPGPMPYDMVERSMSAFGEEAAPRIRHVLGCDVAAAPVRAASSGEQAGQPTAWVEHGSLGSFR